MDPTTIRTMIRRKLESGALPHDHIPRFWGGPADGEFCDVCEEVVKADQLLMEAISTATNTGIRSGSHPGSSTTYAGRQHPRLEQRGSWETLIWGISDASDEPFPEMD
jgi:hypothetical protein